MTQRRDVDTYRLTLSELLHEVCVELLDGQDMLEDLSAQRREHQEMDQAADGPNAPAVYEFAEEQIRLRLKRYRELGDRIDEIITLYNELADEALAEDDDDEIGETFSYTGDADWLEWQEIKRKSEDDEYEEDDDDDEYEEDDDDDDSNYETDDDPDDESDRVQEWSLKKKKKDKKKDKKEKKDKKDKKEKKRKDKESEDKSEVDAKKLKKAEESSQATVTTIVENRAAKASEGTTASKPAAKKKPARKTAAKRSAATTKAKRKTAAKPAAKPKVASKK